MGRSPCCPKDQSLNRGTWTAIEDKILEAYIKIHGEGKWRNVAKRAGLKRCGKSCRLRWLNYLRPGIKRGNITNDEEELIIRLHKLLGNRWSLIAGRLPGRTDNEIKNYWNTNIGKKILLGRPNPTKASAIVELPKANTSASCTVIRTRATRCPKVVLMNTSGPQEPHDHHQQQLDAKPVVVENFGIDKSFLSEIDFDLMNTDFSKLSCFENNNNNEVGSSTTCDTDHSSPAFIDHALLVSKETELHGSEDFQLMAPLTVSEYFDWLFVSEDTLHGSEENSDDQSKYPTLSAPKDRCF
ncbi:hypothetical protein I3842_02G133500 [Carya illinoinensis]|uniref:Uncharacterized protein n=1 Tax=Carya illinoinensis TaxID=32201 RepID=A0A922FXA0_CARIL|nr:hypothetical protein I3842_02G133500 [Carya illinoinensis]